MRSAYEGVRAAERDFVRDFIRECCVSAAASPASPIYQRFIEWGNARVRPGTRVGFSEWPWSQCAFGRTLTTMGYEPTRRNGRAYRKGLELNGD